MSKNHTAINASPQLCTPINALDAAIQIISALRGTLTSSTTLSKTGWWTSQNQFDHIAFFQLLDNLISVRSSQQVFAKLCKLNLDIAFNEFELPFIQWFLSLVKCLRSCNVLHSNIRVIFLLNPCKLLDFINLADIRLGH